MKAKRKAQYPSLILGLALLAGACDGEPPTAMDSTADNPKVGLIDGQLVNLPPEGILKDPAPVRAAASVAATLPASAAAGLSVSSAVADGRICACDFTSLGSFTAVGTVIFDTDALTFGGAPGGVDVGGVAVYAVDNISVPPGTAVVGVGSRPLVLVANGTVTIDGTVTVDGENSVGFTAGPFAGGAGGGAGGVGGDAPGSPGDGTGGGGAGSLASGAGGAGFGGAGGAGGFAFNGVPGAGGPTYGDLTAAVDGGSGGGSGGSLAAPPPPHYHRIPAVAVEAASSNYRRSCPSPSRARGSSRPTEAGARSPAGAHPAAVVAAG